jgi:hypothetical protein
METLTGSLPGLNVSGKDFPDPGISIHSLSKEC